jgi:hypothetical protein
MGSIVIDIGQSTTPDPVNNAKLQTWVDLAVTAWGWPPPPNEDGTPSVADTPEARQEFATKELTSYLRETAKQVRRRQLNADRENAITEQINQLE